ncbi:MAG TPA: SufD family Fe-S cluster assembly protein [Candidatus Bathyarchaeia archaeon]
MANKSILDLDYSKYDFKDPETYVFKSEKGLSRSTVEQISEMKKEPEWMRKFRIRSYEHFLQRPMPNWGGNLSHIDFNDIYYYLRPTDKVEKSWDNVPEKIKKTFDRLGIPEAEKKFLAGVGAQYESEVVYHSLLKHLEDKGVIFCDTDTALKLHPEIFKKHFGTIIPPEDNKLAALNSAVWSGGSFIYVPEGVKIELPLQAYFRINAANMGQFERTLIIAEPYAEVNYIEGCLPYEEKISTGQSMVQIGRVMPDDVVINGEGEETLVRSVRVRDYEGDLVKITPLSPQNAFKLTLEHPVLTVKRRDVLTARKQRNDWLREVDNRKLLRAKPSYVPAGELEAGDFLVFPVNKEVEDNPAYSPELLKFLGYYLAEGSAFVHRSLGVAVVELSFGAHEKTIIGEVSGLITHLTGKTPNLIEYKSGVTVVSYSRELMETCVRECGKGASKKKLSRKIMRLPPEKQSRLLETYMKGDGSVYAKGRTLVRASTASEQLAFQLQELFVRQGIYASIGLRRGGPDTIAGRKITRKDQYVISYSLDKKWSEVRKTADSFLVPIKGIQRLTHKGKVYNIEVADSSQSYQARGFVVHNCTAPVYSTDALHSAVVEIIAKKGAKVRYTTLQNWSSDVYNLVTKRAYAYEDATVEWIDANVGSKLTMKYPSVYLVGPRAKAEIVSVAFAGADRQQDTGAKAVHLAPYTSSRITSKSVSKDGGRTTYRGLVHVAKGAVGVKSSVRCDALLMDERSRTDTYPYMEVNEDDATITHEATVGKINEDQMFYLMSRGLTETQALSMIVTGFMEPFTRVLPMEYAVEFNRLIEMEMEGAVG